MRAQICKECKRILKLKEFHYNRETKKYSEVCKSCMDKNYWKYKRNYKKETALATVKNKWKELCPLMSPVEVDQQLYNLKQMYYNQGDKKNEG